MADPAVNFQAAGIGRIYYQRGADPARPRDRTSRTLMGPSQREIAETDVTQSRLPGVEGTDIARDTIRNPELEAAF